jgi:hypothetical protein
MIILCKLCQTISSIYDLTFHASCQRTTKFTSLWTSATSELSPLIEQDVPENILKVGSRELFSRALLIE